MILHPANPDWIVEFASEEKRIRSSIGPDLEIEHIGSTSIPNMYAKPSVDILVGASSESELDNVLEALIRIGYVLEGRRNGNNHSWLSFPTPENRKYIIHLVLKGDDEWTRRISFRDFLVAHPDMAEEYKRLKLELAAKHSNDLNMYTQGKEAFVSEVLAAASGFQKN